jgi:hypothetical protein
MGSRIPHATMTTNIGGGPIGEINPGKRRTAPNETMSDHMLQNERLTLVATDPKRPRNRLCLPNVTMLAEVLVKEHRHDSRRAQRVQLCAGRHCGIRL